MAHAVINGPALRDFLESDTGPVAREMIRRGILVQNRARQLCPVDGGRLRASITWELIHTSGWLIVRVGSNVEYAMFVETGTGIYGPSGTPIRPRNSQYLVFTPKGAPGPVFARQVRGRPATPFLEPALDAGLEEGRPRRSSAS